MSKKLLQAAAGAGGEALYVEDVFSTYLYTGDGTNPHVITNGINLADEGGLIWTKARDSVSIDNVLVDTERATGWLVSNSNAAAGGTSTAYLSFNTDGYNIDNAFNNWNGTTIGDYASWTFRKAEKFFDVVTWSGNDTVRTIPHNLGSTPAVIIIKKTTTGQSWIVYHESLGPTKSIFLEQSAAENTNGSLFFNNTAPTATEFTVSGFSWVNGLGDDFVAYLFASDAGGFGDDGSESIIKCGSYTGTGADLNVDCGFSAGARFILIKRTDSTGDWYVWDSVRGIVAGNDPYLLLNSTAAEVTNDYIDPLSSGFTVTSSAPAALNASGGTYIFLAIS